MDPLELIKKNGTKIFGATFTKADGSLRHMSCMFGCKKHLRGGDLPYSFMEHGNIGVYDMNKGGYRSFKISRLVSLRIAGTEYEMI